MPKKVSYSATVRLPVCLDEKGIRLIDGEPLPALTPGTIGELIVDASDIVDEAVRRQLTRESEKKALSKGESLWARVRDEALPDELARHRKKHMLATGVPDLFVEFRLDADLSLIVSEGASSELQDCQCSVPALPDVTCKSVNHAYTKISEAFEPSRRSHTGNVFSCVFFMKEGRLHPLRKLEASVRSAKPA